MRYDGFSEDAQTAMQASPDYFVWWYSAKSILLVIAAAALAYQLGKSSGRSRSLGRAPRRRRRSR